eukprot:SAG11_NODE_38_length_21705_cov_24.667453_15_plen_110_part_00
MLLTWHFNDLHNIFIDGMCRRFVVYGVVIDVAMMNKIFSSLVSFLVTVVPIILTLHQPTYSNIVGDKECELSSVQVGSLASKLAFIKGQMSEASLTCSFNMTVSDLIAL